MAVLRIRMKYECKKCGRNFKKNTSLMSHLGWCEKINRIGGMAGRKHTISFK